MRIVVEFTPTAWPRLRLIAIALALALAIPGIALASHQFGDVPTTHTFHDDIEDLYGARIATGCGDGNYCPNAAVTRAQMAGFLNRGLGRVARSSLLGTMSSSTKVAIGSVTVRGSNPSGGTVMVALTANVGMYATAAGCPCEATVTIERAGVAVSSEMYGDLPPIQAPDDDTDVVLATQNVVLIPTGVDQTFTVVVQRKVGTAPVYVYGTVTATVYPFDGVGDSPAVTVSTLDGAAHQVNNKEDPSR